MPYHDDYTIRRLQQQCDALTEERDALAAEVARLQQQFQEAETAYDQLFEERNELKSRIRETQTEAGRLRETLREADRMFGRVVHGYQKPRLSVFGRDLRERHPRLFEPQNDESPPAEASGKGDDDES